jgi:hypothetical protein
MSEHDHGSDHEKLKIILPHLLKHNREHVDEMARWLDTASHIGLSDVACELEKVIGHMKETNECLETAIARLKEANREI